MEKMAGWISESLCGEVIECGHSAMIEWKRLQAVKTLS